MTEAPISNDAPAPVANRRGMGWRWILGLVLGGAILGLIFVAYLRPAFLLEVLNLRYCG